MKLGHEGIMDGHLGIRKSTKRITEHFYWPGCIRDINKFCKTCHPCQIYSTCNKTKKPELPLIDCVPSMDNRLKDIIRVKQENLNIVK